MQILLLLRLFGMVAIAEHKKGDRVIQRSPIWNLKVENVRDCSEIDAQLAAHLFKEVRRPINKIELIYPKPEDIIQEPEKNAENTEGDTKSADSSRSTKETVSKNRGTKKDTSPDSSADNQAT